MVVGLLASALLASVTFAAPPHRHRARPVGMGPCCAAAADSGAATRLDEKLKAMNEAQGEARIAAQAAVLNELVAQHRAMHGACAGPGGAACPAGCPMMPGASGRKTP